VQPQQLYYALDRYRTLTLHCARVKTSRPWVSRTKYHPDFRDQW
jgi:hypothetical protein